MLCIYAQDKINMFDEWGPLYVILGYTKLINLTFIVY